MGMWLSRVPLNLPLPDPIPLLLLGLSQFSSLVNFLNPRTHSPPWTPTVSSPTPYSLLCLTLSAFPVSFLSIPPWLERSCDSPGKQGTWALVLAQ